MKTITIGAELLDQPFPDFTKQLVQDWTHRHVNDLATEVVASRRPVGRPAP